MIERYLRLDDDKHGMEWLIITVFAFMGGVVANIIVPSRRGAWGFCGAAIVGAFCGTAAGLSANQFGAEAGWQVIIAATSGVMGDRVLTAVLVTCHKGTMNVNIHGGQNNIGDNELRGDQNQS